MLLVLLIVVGGSLAATAIAFKMKTVFRLFGLLKMIFKEDDFTLGDVVDDLCDLAEANRRGRKELEAALGAAPQSMKFRMHMVKDGGELILGGSKIDDIEIIMENMEEYREQREMQDGQRNEISRGLCSCFWNGWNINRLSIYVKRYGSASASRV